MTSKITQDQLESLQQSLDTVLKERKAFTGKDQDLISHINQKLDNKIKSDRDVQKFSFKDDGDFVTIHDSRAPNSPISFRYHELVKEVNVGGKENINRMLDSLGFAKRYK